MTHLLSLQKRLILATVVFTLLGTPLSAKGKLTLAGRVVDSDGKKVKKAIVTLLSGVMLYLKKKRGAMENLNSKN